MGGIYRWDEPLRIRMLGGFSLSYKGEEFNLGRGDKRLPLYARFMILLWLCGDRGASVREVTEYIYDGKALKNPRNSVNNLIYLANKMMVSFGAPDTDYFCRIGQTFRACPEVPVDLDVKTFKDLIEKARDEGDIAVYREAVSCYTGPLLPGLAEEPWVIEEARALSSMYREACDVTAQAKAEKGDLNGAGIIYERAFRIEPRGAWEPRRMELLLRQGRDREAIQIYQQGIQKRTRNMRSIREGRILESAADVNQQLLDFLQETEDVFIRIEDERTGNQTKAI